jgi:hypothetical protein
MNAWWKLTDEEAERLNPPILGITEDEEGRVYLEHIVDDKWQPVGYIPSPRTRLGWFIYHIIHGFAMRYPWWKVIGFAFANNKPGDDWIVDLSKVEDYIRWCQVVGYKHDPIDIEHYVAWVESEKANKAKEQHGTATG